MDNKYFICAKYINFRGELKEGFYANDRASGEGYAYFCDDITCSEVKKFNSLEDAKKFLKDEYGINEDGKLEFHSYEYGIIGFPYIVKTELKIETVYELT